MVEDADSAAQAAPQSSMKAVELREHAIPPDSEEAGSVSDRRSIDPADLQRRCVGNALTFLWVFIAFAMTIGAWSIASPLMSGPDEPGHVNQAAAIVRGQIDEREQPLSLTYADLRGSVAVVRVPKWVEEGHTLSGCYVLHITGSAGCAPHIGNQTRLVNTTTQFSNYPPLYYLIVGWTSLVWRGAPALYAMRLVGTLVNAGFIALGIFLLARYHPRRLPLVGALVALSPMVFFVSAVINSSGLEIATAFAAWCGGLCIVERAHVPPALVLWTSISFVVLILSRPISPLNAVIIITVLCTLAGWGRSRRLSRNNGIRALFLSIIGACVTAAAFLAVGGAPVLTGVATKPLSLSDSVWLTLRATMGRLRQCIGLFGSLDTPAPSGVVVVWTAVVAGLIVFALFASARCRRALPILVISIVALPVVFESPHINAVGPYWQGRYWLPLAVGVPLVASSQMPRRAFQRLRSPTLALIRAIGFVIVGSIISVAQLAAFLTALHRYETGLQAAPGTPVQWTPPGGTDVVVTVFVIGEVLLLGFVIWKSLTTKVHSADSDGSLLPHQRVAEQIGPPRRRG